MVSHEHSLSAGFTSCACGIPPRPGHPARVHRDSFPSSQLDDSPGHRNGATEAGPVSPCTRASPCSVASSAHSSG